MDQQQLFNMMFAVAGALGGWWMKAMWESLKELEKADRNLNSTVSDLKVLVAGQCVKTDAFDKFTAAMLAKLDRIEDKLDNKVDKT